MTGTITIKSNNHWRNFLYGYELTDKEKQDFDYLPADDIDSHDFIRYQGVILDPGEFMLCPQVFKAWHGYQSDTFFSGTLIRVSEDGEQYQIGRYYS